MAHAYSVEIGRYDGAYTVRFSGENEAQAFGMYRALNVGNGYKKRLRVYGRTIARQLTAGYVRPRHIRTSPLDEVRTWR